MGSRFLSYTVAVYTRKLIGMAAVRCHEECETSLSQIFLRNANPATFPFLTTFPTCFAGFKHLTECTLIYIQMTDDSLARFLSHCPLLRKFNLRHCDGLQMPVISALNLTESVLQLNRPQQLIVNCPKLRTEDKHVYSRLEGEWNVIL